MPIKGTFTADFSSFFDAVQKADVQLKGFEASTNKVETSLNKMVDNFSGRKIITDATLMAEAVEKVGGMAHLTEAELARVGATAQEAAAKLRAWGQDVPQNIQVLADSVKTANTETSSWGTTLTSVTGIASAFGVSLSVGAVVNFTKAIMDSAEQLEKLSARTGIDVETLQRFAAAGGAAGNTLDEMSGAAVKLTENLASGKTSTIGALETLGIKVDDFKKLSMDEQLLTISAALKEIPDPAQQVALAFALMGQVGVKVLPTLKSDIDEVEKKTKVMSENTTRFWSDAATNLSTSTANMKASAAEWGEYLFGGWTRGEREAKLFAAAMGDLVKSVPTPGPFVGLVPPKLPADLKAIEDGLTASAKAQIEAAKAAKELEKAQEAVNKIEREGIEIRKGALGLSGDEQQQTQKLMESYVKGYDTIEKARAKLDDVLAKSALSSTDYQIVQIWRESDERVKAFKGSEEQRRQYAAVEMDLATAQAQAVRDAADKAAAAAEAAAQRTVVANTKAIKSYWEEVDAAYAAMIAANKKTEREGYDISVGERAPSIDPRTGKWTDAKPTGASGVISAGGPGDVAVSGVIPWEGSSGYAAGINYNPNVGGALYPKRAGGGPVDAGGAYMVGELGPELFTPSTPGFITPTGGGAPIVNHFHLVDNTENLARKVSAQILRSVQQGTKLQ